MQRGRWTELLSNIYRGRTLIVWALWACAFFVANGLNNWMPSLYNTVYHLSLAAIAARRFDDQCRASRGPARLRVQHRSNRPQELDGRCVYSGRRNAGVSGNHGRAKSIERDDFGTLGYGLIGSVNAVLYLYTPEIYPTRMRAIGTGLATSWLRIASAVGPALVGFMVDAKGIHSVFLMFAGISVVGALAATCMVETSDRRLEEIAP